MVWILETISQGETNREALEGGVVEHQLHTARVTLESGDEGGVDREDREIELSWLVRSEEYDYG